MKGVFEFEVSGKKRGFKFGTYAFKVTCEREKCSLDELDARINDPDPLKKIDTLINLFYGAAVHYALSNKQEIDFNEVEVSDWIDEIGEEKASDMILTGSEQHIPKNSTSPVAEAGETVSQ